MARAPRRSRRGRPVTKRAVSYDPLPPAAISSRDADRYLGLPFNTLAKMRCKGEGPPFVRFSDRTRGRALGYIVCDLDAWLQARRVTP